MERRLTLAVIAVAGAFSALAGRVQMDRSKLLIGAYSFRSLLHDEPHVRELKECGIDFVTGVNVVTDRKGLDILAKYGIGVVGGGALSGWWGGNGERAGMMRKFCPRKAYESQLAEFAAKYDHPAIWKLALCDEPSALDMQYLGEICGLIAERTPQTKAYINLYPNYASVSKNSDKATVNQLGTATYGEHIDEYCRTIPLDYISYDFYVYESNTNRRDSLYRQMYDNFNIVADACRRTGRSFWYIPQVNSHESYRGGAIEPTSENRLRFQAYTAMAFGAEAISWACWMPGWWTNNVYTADGVRTEQYGKLKAVNEELHRIGPDYMRYRSVATHYVGFSAVDGAGKLGVPLHDALDTGYFRGLEALEATPLVVGEMSPRMDDDRSRALFVVASGDPFDYAPATRTIIFRVADGRTVRAINGHGDVPLMREADGAYAFKIAENSAVMLISQEEKR